ncbi:MAG: DNA phosphorothioation-associated protein 4 [Elainellaceae cyanobacterium]
MPLARVHIAEEKGDFVKSLRLAEDSTGLFNSYSELLTFAAAIGVSRSRRVPIEKSTKYDPDPIPQDQFKKRFLIDLIAVHETQDPKILTNSDEHDVERVKIFEEYANGGLEILAAELSGSIDYTEQILLLLKSTSDASNTQDEFDLSRFI